MADIQKLLDQLKSEDDHERYAACKELGVSPSIPDEAIAALRELTQDPNYGVAYAAQQALDLHKPKSTTMFEKEEFFNLVPATQNKLRSFMAIMSIFHILQYLLVINVSDLGDIIGIGINLIILYFSIFTTQAPNFYFRLITWIFWFAIIFDIGVSILFALFGDFPFVITIIFSLISLAILVFFARSVMSYRRSVREAKKIKSSRTEQ